MTIDAPSRSDIPALRSLWREAFGDGEAFLDSFFETAYSPERCRCVIEDGGPVAALYWFDCECRGERVAYIYAVATARAYRGRGLCTALMSDTHRHLVEHGYSIALLVPGSRELFDFYGKIGYSLCTRIGEIRTTASERGVELHKIDAKAYAELRRNLLPNGSVIQENENLSFLSRQMELLAGDGLLLAASRRGDTLYGAELLGDIAAAPAILKALGCEKGVFRVPGADIPFSMYASLTDKKICPPSYFGFAFD